MHVCIVRCWTCVHACVCVYVCVCTQELLDSTVAGAADPHTTLVVYMGLQTLPNLYQQLAAHGMTPDLPAVAVERGTTRRQRVAWGTVSELPQRAAAAGLKSPALIIIGQVCVCAFTTMQ